VIVPFGGIIIMFVLYFLYLRKRKVNVLYYVLGYFIPAILLAAILTAVIGAFFLGGGYIS